MRFSVLIIQALVTDIINACDGISAVEDLLVPVDKRQRKNTAEDGRHV